MILGAEFKAKTYQHLAVRLGHAEQIRTRVRTFTDNIAEYIGLDPELALDGERVKRLDRAMEKRGSVSRNSGDLFGRRFLFENPHALERLKHLNSSKHPIIQEGAKRGIIITSVDDYHAAPKSHGYIATHLNILVTGNKGWEEAAELQILSKPVKQAYDMTVPYYQLYRSFKEHAERNGRSEPSDWLPEEKEIILPLGSYIRALFEERAWAAGLMGFRKDEPVSRNQEEAARTAVDLQPLVAGIREFYESYQDPDIMLSYHAALKKDVPVVTEMGHHLR